MALIAFPARHLTARPATDKVTMKNGDRITCEIKTLEAGVLKVNLDYVDGTISIDWLKVARIESPAMFLIQLADGSIYSAHVLTADTGAGGPMKVQIQTEEEAAAAVAPQTEIVRMTQTSESFFRRFSGSISLGAQYSKGNSTTQYNLGSELDYLQTRWGVRGLFNSTLSSSTGAAAATHNQVTLNAYRLLPWKNWFYGGLATFLQSSVQGINRQTNLGAGLGRFLKNTDRVRFSLFAGVGWQRTNYTGNDSQPSQDIGVGLVVATLDAFRFKKTRLSLSVTGAPAITDPGRLFLHTNATYYLKLFGKIDWNLSFFGNWDTRPPSTLRGSDYGSSTGLSYTFGNK
jgi:putative salt-induced outer membrane protein YdiY